MKRLIIIVPLMWLCACSLIHNSNPPYGDRSGIQAGETITVQGSENIYTIAHEHNVSMRDLIALNGLRPPFEVHSGQSLVLPVGGSSFAGNMPAPSPAPLMPVEKNAISPIEPASVSAEPLAPIAPAPSPANTAPQSFLGSPAPPSSKLAPSSMTSSEPVPSLNRASPSQQQTATTMTSPSPLDESSLSMSWPVQGPILSGFGSKGPGLNNDGINISAPKGSPVAAAAAGTVVYAGDEMKGFGNLVLIRHQEDWVTAYAHLDRVLVKKDTVVGQGDVIGTVGKTGNVATPQLHFETRHGGKAVDPAGVIKSSL